MVKLLVRVTPLPGDETLLLVLDRDENSFTSHHGEHLVKDTSRGGLFAELRSSRGSKNVRANIAEQSVIPAEARCGR